jgi:serine/threonine protein kinase
VPGTIVGGRYQLRTAIGNGGMGTVWQAVDTVLRRDVAVKEVLLPPGMPPSERTAMYERTFREGRAAAALSHPSVVQVYDVVTENGRPWIVMELLQARSLSEIIIADGPIAGRAVAKIGIALLGALEVAHAAGVLHRDVKPANVLICGDGRCVLTDFGVARMPSESNLTQPGMVLGSPHFISPERAIGAAFGPPSDLFSLGVTLYTAAEGRPPFDRGDPFDTMRAIVEDEPTPAVRAGVLTPVLMGLLIKDPAQRWTVGESRQALRDLVSGPLTNRAATHLTDPYAVMPTSPPVGRAIEPPPPPGGRLGGRAMLGDDESISERLATVTATSEGTGTHRRRPTPPPRDGVVLDATESGMPAVPPYLPGRGETGARPAMKPPTGIRGWSRNLQIAVAGGVAAVLIVGVVLAVTMSGGGAKTNGTPGSRPSVTASVPPAFIETQAFTDPRGITLNVPKSWKQKKYTGYTDYLNPDDSTQKLRINVEVAGQSSASAFLKAAEGRLKSGKGGCPDYARVALNDIQLDRRPGAELEYTCGTGDAMRHGIWAATLLSGHAYHFYLSVPDSAFKGDKPIYDEMVASFKLTAK